MTAVVRRGSETARQFATTRIAYPTWQGNFFRDHRGTVLQDELKIRVAADGERYWLNDELHNPYSEAEKSATGGNLHVGEKDKEWED